jgi:hypothetical protein
VNATPSGPPIVDQVPDVLPRGGIRLQGGEFLFMPPADRTPELSAERALELAHTYMDVDAQPRPPAIILARVTILSSLPPPGEPPGKVNLITGYGPVEDVLVWVLTWTFAPSIVSQSPRAARPVTHSHLLLDAQTGAFVRGFFTP